MEFSKIKIAGAEVNVVFTGKQYIFQNDFHGIVAVATRTGEYQESKASFLLNVGNSHCLGSRFADCTVVAAAKRFINKNESRYIHVNVSYSVYEKDLNRCYIDCSVKDY